MEACKILITGTNRGLGKELVNHLATKRPDLHLFLTARTDPVQAKRTWAQKYSNVSITCLQLDIMDQKSKNDFFKCVAEKQWRFRYLVNNAAIGADLGEQIPSVDLATRTFQCNVTATIEFTKRMLEHLTQDARIVMVSSGLAGLKYQPSLQKRQLMNSPELTEQLIQDYIQDYIKQCEEKKLTWLQSAYGTSKLFLNSWSRFILQEKILKEGQSVVCMSPGPCDTDMGPPNPKFTASQGSKFIFDCIFNQAKKGVFYHTGNQRDFEWCGLPQN